MEGLISVAGFGLVVVLGGFVMAALNYFSKGKSFEDVLAEQKLQKEQEDKERSRINKQKRENYKKRFESKKKKGNLENGKMEMSPTYDIQIKSTTNEDKKKKNKEVKAKKEQPAKAKPAPKPVEEAKPVTKATPAPVAKPVVKQVPVVKQAPVAKPVAKQAPVAKEDVVAKAPKPVAKNNVKEKKVKVVEAAVVAKKQEVEQIKPKKKKSKKQEHPILEELRQTELDENTRNSLLQLLTSQQGGGDWATAGSAGKQQSAEVQRKLEEREADHSRELNANLRKIKDLTQMVEVEKNRSASEVIRSREEASKLQQEVTTLNAQLQVFVADRKQKKRHEDVGNNELQEKMTSLKEENDILKMTLQANAKDSAEKSSYMSQVQTLTLKLQESEKAKLDIEHRVQSYNETVSQRQVELETSYSHRIDELVKKAQDVQGQYGALEANYQKTQSDLELTQSQSAKLLQQVALLTNENEQKSRLEAEYGSLTDTKRELEDRLLEMDRSDAHKASEVAKLHSQNKDLLREVGELRTELNKTTVALNQSSDQADRSTEESNRHSQLLEGMENNLATLRNEINLKNNDLETLQGKLKDSENNLETLQLEMNTKTADVISLNDETAKLKQKNKEDGEKLVREVEDFVRSNLSQCFPGISCKETTFSSWLTAFLTSAAEPVVMVNNDLSDVTKKELQQLQKSNSELVDKLNEQSSMTSQLQDSLKQNETELAQARNQIEDKSKEVDQFKSVLASTEKILSDLHRTVEESDRERREGEKKAVEDLREEVKKANQSREAVEKELSEKVGLLTAAEEERDAMKAAVEKPAPSTVNGTTDQQVELEKLKERLEKEKMLTKNLGAAAGKLKSVLQQTQEQLGKEREKNRDLSEQMSKRHSSSSSSSSSSGSDLD